jgi:hypothetical protein
MARDLEDMGFKGGSPTESTLRDWAKRGVITEDSEDGPWLFTDDEPEDAALMLPVLRGYLVAQAEALAEARKRYIIPAHLRMGRPTRRFARWLIRIRKLTPDMPVSTAWMLALEAQAHEYAIARGLVNEAADPALVRSFLALTPWKDEGALMRKAVEVGALPGAIARLADEEKALASELKSTLFDWEDEA